jgi:hypothetical protein
MVLFSSFLHPPPVDNAIAPDSQGISGGKHAAQIGFVVFVDPSRTGIKWLHQR